MRARQAFDVIGTAVGSRQSAKSARRKQEYENSKARRPNKNSFDCRPLFSDTNQSARCSTRRTACARCCRRYAASAIGAEAPSEEILILAGKFGTGKFGQIGQKRRMQLSGTTIEQIQATSNTENIKSDKKSKLSATQLAKLRAIRPTCASCGLPARIDCHNTCAYIFGKVPVTTALPPEIAFNEDHQFSISVPVYEGGRNFGNQRSKLCWFNSVRCAEAFLILHGHAKGNRHDKTTIGNGDRLLAFLGGSEVVKERKKRGSLEYKQAQMMKCNPSHCLPLPEFSFA